MMTLLLFLLLLRSTPSDEASQKADASRRPYDDSRHPSDITHMSLDSKAEYLQELPLKAYLELAIRLVFRPVGD